MSRRTLLVFAWALALFACVQPCMAEESESTGQPHFSRSTMSIPWSEFKTLLDRLERAEKKEPPVAPPFDWSITNAHYDAEALSNRSVKVTATLGITVLKNDGWVEVPLMKNTVAPVSVRLDGSETALNVGEGGQLSLLLDSAGVHTLEITFFVRATFSEGVASFAFPCPRTPLTQMTLRVPSSEAHITAPDALNVDVEKSKDSVAADLAFLSTDEIKASWSMPALVKKAAPVKASTTCTVSTLASITDRYVSCESHLRFDLLKGSMNTLRLRLPSTVNVLDVSGQGAAWTAAPSGEFQEIEVKLNHSVDKDYTLVLKYETPLTDEIATLKMPELTIMDVVRQTGFIGVAALSNVELSASPETDGLTRIDTTELPSVLRTLSQSPLLMGFKYTDSSYLLALDVRRLEDVPVRVAGIDRMSLLTMITEDGQAITRARFDVRNNIKQFLGVEVGKDAEIWSAEVGGRVVKPAKDTASDAILIPLFKSIETNRRLGSFPVELIYMQHLSELPKVAGELNLEAPSTDLLANEVEWEVRIPEGLHVYGSSGDLKPLKSAAVADGQMTRPTTRVQRETVYKLRQGIERFLITDINGPSGSAGAMSGDKYKGEPLKPGKAYSASAALEVAGVLPVQIGLSAEGKPYYFRQVMVERDKPLKLAMRVCHSGFVSTAKALMIVLGISAGLAIGRAFWLMFSVHKLPRRIIGAAVVCSALAAILHLFAGLAVSPALTSALLAAPFPIIVPLMRRSFNRPSSVPVVPDIPQEG